MVYDNNGKDIDTCRPLIDAYRGKVQHYVFVSSAGMYKADAGQPMSLEGDKRAEKDHFYVEEYLKQVKMPYTIFRCGLKGRQRGGGQWAAGGQVRAPCRA